MHLVYWGGLKYIFDSISFDWLLIQKRTRLKKFKEKSRQYTCVCVFFKFVTKIKCIPIEWTSTKAICSALRLGNGDSQETNEPFDFWETIRIFVQTSVTGWKVLSCSIRKRTTFHPFSYPLWGSQWFPAQDWFSFGPWSLDILFHEAIREINGPSFP